MVNEPDLRTLSSESPYSVHDNYQDTNEYEHASVSTKWGQGSKIFAFATHGTPRTNERSWDIEIKREYKR